MSVLQKWLDKNHVRCNNISDDCCILRLSYPLSLHISPDKISIIKGSIVIDEVKVVSCSDSLVSLSLRGNKWYCEDKINLKKDANGLVSVIISPGYIASALPEDIVSKILPRESCGL
jgi:hypothetical protein